MARQGRLASEEAANVCRHCAVQAMENADSEEATWNERSVRGTSNLTRVSDGWGAIISRLLALSADVRNFPDLWVAVSFNTTAIHHCTPIMLQPRICRSLVAQLNFLSISRPSISRTIPPRRALYLLKLTRKQTLHASSPQHTHRIVPSQLVLRDKTG